MSDEIKVGDMVETAVYVGVERRPTGRGRVEAVHSGYCDVDHCYPYGAPWIYGETTSSLRKLEDSELHTYEVLRGQKCLWEAI